MKYFIALLATFAFFAPAFADPKWSELKPERDTYKGGTMYDDILNHDRERTVDYGDRRTTAHEAGHGIHAYIRNEMVKWGKNAFYVGNDKYCVLPEPKLKLHDIRQYVPENLYGTRAGTYLVDCLTHSPTLDDSPLYIYDEWACYLIGARVGLEDSKAGLDKEGVRDDYMESVVEFIAYAGALTKAIDKIDPEYMSKNPDFKEFTAWMIKEAISVYKEGQKYPRYKDYADTFAKLKNETAFCKYLQDKFGVEIK